MDKRSAIIHIINSIGDSVDSRKAAAVVKELLTRNIITVQTAKILTAAVAERPYQSVPAEYRDTVRAAVLKNMLLNLE